MAAVGQRREDLGLGAGSRLDSVPAQLVQAARRERRDGVHGGLVLADGLAQPQEHDR